MFEVRRTDEFVDRLKDLRDVSAKARIAKCIDRNAEGNFGDTKSVGGNVSELYFWRRLPSVLHFSR
jgi:putative addiction module killer protein